MRLDHRHVTCMQEKSRRLAFTGGSDMRPRLIVSLVLLGLILIIAVQNAETVELSFLVWHLSISRVLLIFITGGIGFLAGYLMARFQSATGGKA
ncbi:MAG: LapA family protein [Gemmatimonadetes bacterium]|nr:LapA family protein [Gemmatimonadota bacterium]